MSLRTRLLRLITLLGMVLGLLFQQPPAAAASGIIYVNYNATGANTGASWADAYPDLQTALGAATAEVEIWVAAGTYTPTSGTDRSIAFVMKEGVKLYGGFSGTETTLEQRNWKTNLTILSGDIGTLNDNTDNSYHVIKNVNNGLTAAAVLDGFTITGGNANSGGYPDYYGGGMLNYASSLTLTNLIFSANSAQAGGGMFNHASSPTLINVSFSANSAQSVGGGMLNETGSSPTLTNVSFSTNSANEGGGMVNLSSSPTLTNVSFSANSAPQGYGGGMSNMANSNPTLINVSFSANSALDEHGGGMYNNYFSSPTIYNSILWGNTGGEVINYDSESIPTIAYSIVQGGYGGTGNLDIDPLFVNGPAGDLHLQATSPAVDLGSTSRLPDGLTTDLDGSPRVVGSAVDLGAYEQQAPNTAPLLSGAFNLPDLTEDPSTNPGSLISSFLTGPYASDGDNNPLGMAVIAADNTHGQWQYSLNGTDWSNLSGLSPSSALVLAPDAALRFAPAAGWNSAAATAASLTFRAWDGADGRASGTGGVNASVNGLATPFSAGSAALSINVTPVNDPPVNTALPLVSGTAQVGQLNTASPGNWDDSQDQPSPTITYAYQWQSASDNSGANLTSIPAATGTTYTPTAVQWLRVQVTATDDGIPNTASAIAYSAWAQITQGNQTISFGPLANKIIGDPDFDLSATATSGLTVSFSAAGSCTMAAANTVHLTGAGSCTITATQAGDENYTAALPVDQSFQVSNYRIFLPLTAAP